MDKFEMYVEIRGMLNQKYSIYTIARKLNISRNRAARNPFQETLYKSHLLSMGMYIDMLLQYKEHLSKLETEIDTLAKEIEEYKIIQSIPGIGEKIAATIISEIGEIDRFNHPKKLVTFAGVDPEVFESGKFKATLVRITKRGSSHFPRYCLETISN